MATPIPANRAVFSLDEAARATGGTLVARGEGDERVAGFTTDSRVVAAGGAFVALRGETHDGHAFADRAVAQGARLLVVERGKGPRASRAAVLEVDDTLAAWGALGRAHLRAWRSSREGRGLPARIVGITGSAGKTTTKELCAALLATQGETLRTEGNLNNRVGLPAVALCVEDRHAFAVLEMGMSLPGEIAKLVEIAEPDVAIIVNVGVAHAEGVGGGREAVAREKGSIIAGLDARGVAVLNADDEAVMAQRERTKGRVLTFGRAASAAYRLIEREARGLRGAKLVVRRPGEEITLELSLVGEPAAIDFVAALAAADAAAGTSIPADAVRTAALRAAPVAGRAAARTLADGTILLDDTYNANPSSVLAALATLAEIGAGRRLVVVLGEMKELGAIAEEEHARVGEALASHGVALAIGCGGLAKVALERAAKGGVEVVSKASAVEAAEAALARIAPGDAVLVKGSRSVGTEKVVQAIESTRSGGNG
jgi:UDP-N-acetylmuramoyl-tripeptide--D-alanyl-D-alanine ligase